MFNRKLVEFGLHPSLGYLLMIVIFIVLSLILFKKITSASYVYLVLALSTVTTLSEGFRTDFLKSIFSNKEYLKIRCFENIIIAIPFVIFLLFKLNTHVCSNHQT